MGTKASKESSFEIPEIPEILENLSIEEDEPIEVKVEKPEEIKSGEIEQKLATKRTTKARKNTDSRFYKPEHIELLMQTYEKCSKYPSKEEIQNWPKLLGCYQSKFCGGSHIVGELKGKKEIIYWPKQPKMKQN